MLRRFTILALALCIPTLAAAQSHRSYGPAPQGLTLSAWGGLGLPTGRFADDGGSVGDVVGVSVPIGIGAYYRFNPHFRLGGLFEVAPLTVDDSACPDDSDCSGTSYRIGIDAQYHFTPFRRVDPWLGVGFGYEWTTLTASTYDYWTDTDYYADTKFNGWLFPRFTGGLDFAVAPRFTVGPYFSYALGEYSHVDYGDHDSGEISHKAFHGWFEIGVRGNFNL